ncbi:MAG: glycosyltransferase [bacterium]|nr:glycosyltransferase [bacterium]
MSPSIPVSDTRAPVIVAGMHRSGTSLVASWLREMGVEMGAEMVPPDANNRHGYFEDTGFLELNRRLLEGATPGDDGGHPDWGWTESEQLDLGSLDERLDDARELIAASATGDRYWGWKDPRTTLLLDFWDRASGGEARYVLLYRYPWDVADSMQRLGADVFLRHPEYAYSIWRTYNRRLLDFHRRHRDRAALVSTNALVHDPGTFADLLRDKLGLGLDPAALEDVFDDEGMFATLEGTDPLIGLVAATSPECVELLAELDDEADLSSAGRWRDPGCLAGVPDDPPTVSVVLPCFDHGHFLVEAVASVERCAPGSEMIIVDDGSSQPATLEILEVLRGAGYNVVTQENQGLAAARNTGIELARGAYVLPLDADNRLRAGFVSAAAGILDARPEVGVVYSDRRDFGARSGVVELGDFDPDRLLVMNYIDACAVFRKDLWATAGGYDPGMTPWEDWELWVAGCERGWRFHHLAETGFDYRVRPGSLAHDANDPEIRRRLVARVVARHEEIYRRRLTNLATIAGELAQGLIELDRKRGAQVMSRDAELARRDQEIRRRDNELTSAYEEIRRRDNELASAYENTRHRDAELASAYEEIRKRDTDLVNAYEEVRKRDTENVRRCEQIRKRDAEITRRDHKIVELEEAAGAREDDHAWLEEKLAEQETAMAEARRGQKWLEGKLAERDAEIDAARESLETSKRETAALADELEGSRRSLAAAEADRAELERRGDEQQDLLDRIHASRGWRLASFLGRVAERLLPRGSARRRFVGRLSGRPEGGR